MPKRREHLGALTDTTSNWEWKHLLNIFSERYELYFVFYYWERNRNIAVSQQTFTFDNEHGTPTTHPLERGRM